jgi:phosphoribosyl 1,2-cyclic phosphate phosphodiesterase
MALRFTILGCGTSSGVPRIGNDWGSCDPDDPRNRRLRASIIVESETTRILVDTSPDLRAQLLAADISHLDAVLWTHDHADHCHGIDDLRQIAQAMRAPLQGYARKETLQLLTTRFAYAFEGRAGYPSVISGQVLTDNLTIGDIEIQCVDQPHGSIFSTGFRFQSGGKSIGYSTDFHEVTKEMLALFEGVDMWIIDALRVRRHPTHAHLAVSLDAINKVNAQQALLTHMDHSMDYATLAAMLPDHIRPAHDGLSAVI